MAYNKTEKLVNDLLIPITERLGLTVWDVEFKKEDGGYVLRALIDRDKGVSIEDCESVSVALGEELDRLDPIPMEYTLEVSSAGLTRELKRPGDFSQFAGRLVDVKTYAPVDGDKEFSAVLRGFENGTVLLEKDGKEVAIPQEKTVSVRLGIEF